MWTTRERMPHHTTHEERAMQESTKTIDIMSQPMRSQQASYTSTWQPVIGCPIMTNNGEQRRRTERERERGERHTDGGHEWFAHI